MAEYGTPVSFKNLKLQKSLVEWVKNYFSSRKQRIVLPGAMSKWNSIYAGVPQGSIFGPFLFLLYINDIVTNIKACIRFFRR